MEGVIGGGDGGGPVLIKNNGAWKLAGVAEGLHGKMPDLLAMRAGTFHQGVRGQDFVNSRASYYAPWIEDMIGTP